MEFKKNQFVIVAGEGNSVFIIENIDEKGKRILLHTGWWEPIHKCQIVPEEKVIKTVEYYYDL